MQISRIIEPRMHDLGGDLVVRRVLPFHAHRSVGPFVFFDHFGPVEFDPGASFNVLPHPHIGLSTVTFLFDGAIRHRDSLGTDLVIEPGAVNWMTAGRGIVHSERTPDSHRKHGQVMHGLQTWVALPRAEEDCAPAFIHHPADTLPAFRMGNVRVKVLAGSAWEHTSPVSFPWPILYVALEADSDADIILPAEMAIERALYVVTGGAQIGDSIVPEGRMAVLGTDTDVTVKLAAGTKAVVCGGRRWIRRARWIGTSCRATAQRLSRPRSIGRRPWKPGDRRDSPLFRGMRKSGFPFPPDFRHRIPVTPFLADW
ncbi:MAG: pirin family protein [Hyphomonas sp.]